MISIEEHLKQTLNEGMEILTNYNVFVGNPKKDIPQQYVYQTTKLLNRFDNQDLKKELFGSKHLSIAIDKKNKTVVSCATMRIPREKRKTQIFSLANARDIQNEYKYELSNLYTHPNYRNQGILKYLVHRMLLLRAGRGETIYALSTLDFVTQMLLNYFQFETIENIEYNGKKMNLLGLI